uniref:hypothetical protein n=1 Tax=Pararhizobium sp. IMCC3301 TaxID=3067904 RepID=UPI0027425BE0|nr:hypothetical protein [Pararhizobium sp. IMCC3301]
MLAKLLILVGIIAAVYIAAKRHKFFAHLTSGGGEPDQPDKSENNTIEELDYDPETGRYSVRKNKRDQN